MPFPASSRNGFPQPLFESESTVVQRDTEMECEPYFADLTKLAPDQIDHLRQTGLLPLEGLELQLLRDKHAEYLSQVWERPLGGTCIVSVGGEYICDMIGTTSSLIQCPDSFLVRMVWYVAPFVSLDASRPWILYWCLQGVDLLEKLPSDHDRCRMVSTLEHCWSTFGLTEHPVTENEDPFYYSEGNTALLAGGFGGGPSQMPHAATTYAAVLSLCILVTSGGESALRAKAFLQKIRLPLYRWMVTLLDKKTGSYRMHTDGEVDVRASYTILCSATLLGIASPTLCQDNVAEFIQSCQTFEGGLGGEPWSEAHGGYAYCGVAALQILGKLHVLDLPALTGWLARRQMSFEGGFSGRSNKLVDGCYSFWQGGETFNKCLSKEILTKTLHFLLTIF